MNTDAPIYTKLYAYDLDRIVDAIISAAAQLQFSVVIWKLPNSQDIQLNVFFNNVETGSELSFTNTHERRFIVCPFDISEGIMFFRSSDFKILIEESGFQLMTGAKADERQLILFIHAVLNILQSSIPGVIYHVKKTIDPDYGDDKQRFVTLVESAIERINVGKLKKVIAARTKTLPIIQNEFSLFSIYRSLCEVYPNTFVSLLSTQITGTWLGASPELLVNLDRHHRLHTVSLAGTRHKCTVDGAALWTNKENDEQALVTKFITDIFKEEGVKQYSLSNLTSCCVGDICHLKTTLRVDLNRCENKHVVPATLIRKLHPTAAICGAPKLDALAFIHRHEDFDRALYGGFLGPLNEGKETNLFVNIRCMQFLEKNIIIYAGAGITAGSDPEAEWVETQFKCEMMARIVGEQVQ